MDVTVAVTAVRDVGPRTIAIEFETPTGLDAEPGQFLKLTGVVSEEEYARFYTLSSPGIGDTFEITVGVDPDESGPFTEFLRDLAAGDTVEIAGPFGRNFYEGESRVVVLAGGPGVGPAVGIGEAAVADDNEVAVVYRADAPAHTERLDALREAGASVAVTDSDIADHVAAAITDGPDEQVFVYGFEEFIDDATAALDAAGTDPDAAKAENFG
jgi:cytochrome-b5 reductase